jgi:DNA-binding CsgD family transcriptional regulator
MKSDRLAKVPQGQRDCLRLVLGHMSSKEIGRMLGISSHTVDQRLKQAMRTLGASSRVEAARMLAALEGGERHQPLVYQAADIDREPASSALPPPEVPNDRWRRLGWIGLVAVGAAVGLAALFTFLNQISEFTR